MNLRLLMFAAPLLVLTASCQSSPKTIQRHGNPELRVFHEPIASDHRPVIATLWPR
ncbi:MAG: hypothetical protein ACI9EF_003815 [Pseudohongiellaceae bacterium]|jgi:hypothetical protein